MIFRKLKVLFSAVRNFYLLAKRKERRVKNCQKVVYLDCFDFRMQYYYFFFLFSYLEAGYYVRIKARLKLLAGFSPWVDTFLKCSRVSFYFRERKFDLGLYFTDKASKFGRNKRLFLSPNWNLANRGSVKDNHLVLPYQMHPDVYFMGLHNKVNELRASKRKIAIFYSGNSASENYNFDSMVEKFGIQNRYNVVEALCERLDKNELFLVNRDNPLSVMNEVDFFNRLVMIKWGWSKGKSFNFESRVRPDNWLSTLASANFFLALPGIKIPFSHNAIEAMSVGTIPILAYPDLFSPALKNEINCFSYNSIDELLLIIRKVLNMSSKEIEIMRNNVIDYYDKNLINSQNLNLIEIAVQDYKEIAFINEIVY